MDREVKIVPGTTTQRKQAERRCRIPAAAGAFSLYLFIDEASTKAPPTLLLCCSIIHVCSR
jgi:hypothetical protein